MKLKKEILAMRAPQDTVVEINSTPQIYQSAWHPKNFISLDGADHLLTQKADAVYVG